MTDRGWFDTEIEPAFQEVKKAIDEGYQKKFIIQSLLKLILACTFLTKEDT